MDIGVLRRTTETIWMGLERGSFFRFGGGSGYLKQIYFEEASYGRFMVLVKSIKEGVITIQASFHSGKAKASVTVARD